MKKFTSLVGSALLMLLALFPQTVKADSETEVESYLNIYNTAYAEPGKSFDYYVVLTNKGEDAISKLSYSVLVDGMDIQKDELTFDNPIASGNDRVICITALAPQESNTSVNLEIKITSINGQDISMESTYTKLTIQDFAPKKRSLVEDYTGTWCGYCPRGWVALESINRDNPGKVLNVAYHNSDPMATGTVSNPAVISGYPTIHLNRENWSAYYVPTYALLEMNKPADADVNVTHVTWNNPQYSSATCSATVEFDKDIADDEYKVEFVLVENGMKGSHSGWWQSTYYYYNAGWEDPLWNYFTTENEEMKTYISGEYIYCYAPNLIYNDVCIANSLANENYASYLKATAAHQPITLEYTFDGIDEIKGFYDDLLLQNPEQFHIGIIVTKCDDGSFVNCDWMDIDIASDIQSIVPSIDSEKAEYYTVSGIKVSGENLAPGIYIVRKGNKVSKIRVR